MIYKAVAMCHSRYPPTVLSAGYGRTKFIPTSRVRIAVPLLIESGENAEETALLTDEPKIRYIWNVRSCDDLGNVCAAIAEE
jgi:hypothetical protein